MKTSKILISALLGAAVALSASATAFAAGITIGETELKQAAELTSGQTELGNIQLAGSPALAYVGGKGLMISGRTADWNAIDVLFANLEEGKTYVLEAEMSADTPVQFKIGEADSPYGEMTKSDEDVTSATLTIEITTEDAGGEIMVNGQNRYRLQTTGTDDYYIKSVSITEVTEDNTTDDTTDDTTDETGDTNAPTNTGKGNANTGVAGVAAIAGAAVLAAGAIIISRKK